MKIHKYSQFSYGKWISEKTISMKQRNMISLIISMLLFLLKDILQHGFTSYFILLFNIKLFSSWNSEKTTLIKIRLGKNENNKIIFIYCWWLTLQRYHFLKKTLIFMCYIYIFLEFWFKSSKIFYFIFEIFLYFLDRL